MIDPDTDAAEIAEPHAPTTGPDPETAAAATLQSYLEACAAADLPPRVDWASSPGIWETGVVVSAADPVEAGTTVRVQLDDGGQVHAARPGVVRPHQPCRCQNPEGVHPAGDACWCRSAQQPGVPGVLIRQG